jgi:hypothetical protein
VTPAKYTRKDMTDALVTVLDDAPIVSKREYNERRTNGVHPSAQRIEQVFGTWNRALFEAGIGIDRDTSSRDYDAAEKDHRYFIGAVVKFIESDPERITKRAFIAWAREEGWTPGPSWMLIHCGITWNEAKEAARTVLLEREGT